MDPFRDFHVSLAISHDVTLSPAAQENKAVMRINSTTPIATKIKRISRQHTVQSSVWCHCFYPNIVRGEVNIKRNPCFSPSRGAT